MPERLTSFCIFDIEMNKTSKFCNIIRTRSKENEIAVRLLFNNRLYGQVISILRQELDSMVRCIFLLNIPDLNQRENLISQMLEGKRWKNQQNKIITDKDMVEISNDLQGWTKSVYKFGCSFIHLSNFHNYIEDDPFESLDRIENDNIKNHMHNYHGFNLDNNLTFDNVKPYLYNVFDKISSNLRCYINSVEKEELLIN